MTVGAWKIEPGTLIVLPENAWEESAVDKFVSSLKEMCGHDQFLVLIAQWGAFNVGILGPEEVEMLEAEIANLKSMAKTKI